VTFIGLGKQESNMAVTFEGLPREVHHNVAFFLPADDYVTLSHVNSSIHEILTDDYLWSIVLRTNFPLWVPFPFVRGQTKESMCPIAHAIRLIRNMNLTANGDENDIPFPMEGISDVRLVYFGERTLCIATKSAGFRLLLMHRFMYWKLKMQLSLLGDYWWQYPDQRMGQAWDNMGEEERYLGLGDDVVARAFRWDQSWRQEIAMPSRRQFRPPSRIPVVINQMCRIFHHSPFDYNCDPINSLICLSSIQLDRTILVRLYEDDFFINQFEARWAHLASLAWSRASACPLVYHGQFKEYKDEFPKEFCVVLRRHPVKIRTIHGEKMPSIKLSVQTGINEEAAKRFFFLDISDKKKLLARADLSIIFPAIIIVKLGHDEVTRTEPSMIFEIQSIYPEFIISGTCTSRKWHMAGSLEGVVEKFG